MKKFIAVTIILNVFLSSIYLLVEKENGIYSSLLAVQHSSDSDDNKESKSPLYTELKSEKEDSKSDLDFNFKKLACNNILINFNLSRFSTLYTSYSLGTKTPIQWSTPLFILDRSIRI